MIQIATVGDTQEVVKIGLGKILPEKLYIIHTPNERTKKELEEDIAKAKKDKNPSFVKFLKSKQYEDNVKNLRKEIIKDFNIEVELLSVHKFESDEVIRAVLSAIDAEQKIKKRDKKDYVVNITGGTKAMVAGAACAAYLAQARMYYVLHPDEAKGKELVRELPVPTRAENTSKGDSTKTTGIVLAKLREIDKDCTAKYLFGELVGVKFPFVKKDKKTDKEITEMRAFTPQSLNYHLRKLKESELITVEAGFREEGKKRKNGRQNTIILTETGKHYADYPDILGEVL